MQKSLIVLFVLVAFSVCGLLFAPNQWLVENGFTETADAQIKERRELADAWQRLWNATQGK